MLRRRSEMRHALDRRRAGADDANALSGEVLQPFAGVAVVPAAGVEGLAAKTAEAGDPGQLRLGLVSVGHGDELRPHLVPVVSPADPATSRCIPTYLIHIGPQARVAVEVVVRGDAAAVRKDLRSPGVFIRGDVAEL